MEKGKPQRKTGIQPEIKTIIAVPKSGSLKIRKLQIKIASITINQSLINGFICFLVKNEATAKGKINLTSSEG